MKKIAIILIAIMMCAALPMAAHADEPVPATEIFFVDDPGIPDATDQILVNMPTIPMISDGERDSQPPRLPEGQAGTGEIRDIAAHWEKTGYPDNISFAYLAGAEKPPYNPDVDAVPPTAIAWWEIGVVNADDAAKQEILALMSPDCRVTFRDCAYSYKQREAAFNEITAGRNEIVRNALMAQNSEVVFVEIADGYEKEYAKKLGEQYGWFIVVTNDAQAVDDADPALGGITPEVVVGLDGGMPEIGATPGSGLGTWFWAVCLLALAGAAMLVYFNRARLIPALQTAHGTVITGGGQVSRKQTEEAVKNSALTPPDGVFNSIMEQVEGQRE